MKGWFIKLFIFIQVWNSAYAINGKYFTVIFIIILFKIKTGNY